MLNKKKAKIAKPPKTCIWCGAGGVSKEHFFAEWQAPYMPDSGHGHQRGLTRGHINAPDEIIRRDWKRQGHVGVVTIPAVCEPCNNGWMNVMEQQVRPVLEPLMQGRATVLSPDSQALLATYFAMKVMVADQSIPEQAVFSTVDHKGMFEHRTIPAALIIDMFRFDGDFTLVTAYNREFISGLNDRDERVGLSNFTFRLGPVFVRAVYQQGEIAEKGTAELRHIALRVHPSDGFSHSWPPLRLPEDVAKQIQHSFQSHLADAGKAPSPIRHREPTPASPEDRR